MEEKDPIRLFNFISFNQKKNYILFNQIDKVIRHGNDAMDLVTKFRQ